MKNYWLIALNVVCLVVFTSLICALQTSLWMQILGGFPAPLFWMIILTYVALHRHIGECVLLTYLITIVLASYTAEPFEQFLLANMIGMVFILGVKNRIYWSGPNYFMMMSAAATALHFIVILLLSQFLDHNPIRSPEFFHWMISFLLTLLVSLPVFHFLKWFDKLTHMDETAESTGGLV